MQEVLKKAEEGMIKRIDALEKELKTIRAGRANPGILDKLSIDYYGVPTPVNQMAAVNVPDARTLTIQPWDSASLGLIEKAINASDIGIHPQNDGKIIRLAFPPLTEERRKDISKDIHKMGEECKVAVRNVRRDSIEKLKALKKESTITEDDLKDGEKKVQELTDKYCKEIDDVSAAKQKGILEL
ncbi:MAG: ribosome recycling factor [Oscillospiraceae bacterium]|jgi:ribosome recycling factor|nr:ribosome recycling factor [Oscillospiraceae bacterium]